VTTPLGTVLGVTTRPGPRDPVHDEARLRFRSMAAQDGAGSLALVDDRGQVIERTGELLGDVSIGDDIALVAHPLDEQVLLGLVALVSSGSSPLARAQVRGIGGPDLAVVLRPLGDAGPARYLVAHLTPVPGTARRAADARHVSR
jgi:hypothetical protein